MRMRMNIDTPTLLETQFLQKFKTDDDRVERLLAGGIVVIDGDGLDLVRKRAIENDDSLERQFMFA